MELKPRTAQGEPLQLKDPSGTSAAARGRRASPLRVSALPASPVAASVHP